jgi:hypothetical protein
MNNAAATSACRAQAVRGRLRWKAIGSSRPLTAHTLRLINGFHGFEAETLTVTYCCAGEHGRCHKHNTCIAWSGVQHCCPAGALEVYSLLRATRGCAHAHKARSALQLSLERQAEAWLLCPGLSRSNIATTVWTQPDDLRSKLLSLLTPNQSGSNPPQV